MIISDTGKSTEQCVAAAKKANSILGMIKRNIIWKSKEIIVTLYKSLVRPRLEYCVQAWCPYLQKDIDLLERVQRRATKMISGYGKHSYETRLKLTGLPSLSSRRIRGDLIEVFKLIKGFDKVDYNKFFQIKRDNNLRWHT